MLRVCRRFYSAVKFKCASPFTIDSFQKDFYYKDNWLSIEEETELCKLIEKKLKRLPYENGHFDRVIQKYREVLWTIQDSDPAIIKETYNRTIAALPKGKEYLPMHVIDLHEKGCIGKHVDHPTVIV